MESFAIHRVTQPEQFYGFPKGSAKIDGPFISQSAGFQTETRTFLDYCSSQRFYVMPTPRWRQTLDDTIRHLKLRGIYSQLDCLYLFATDGDLNVAYTNILNPTVFKSSTHAAAGPNGAVAQYGGVYGINCGEFNNVAGIDTGFNPFSSAVNGMQNNNSAFVWLNPTNGNSTNGSANGEIFGQVGATGYLLSFFGGYNNIVNESPSLNTNAPNIHRMSAQFLHLKRVDSTTKELWRNGVRLTSVATNPSVAFTNNLFTVGRNLTTGQLTRAYFGVFGFGSNLAGLEVYLNNTFQKYMANIL